MWLFKVFGAFIELIKGPSVTTVATAEVLHRNARVTYQTESLLFEITSTRIVYKTKFKHWFVMSIKRAVFAVEGNVITGDPSMVDPKLLERVVYPNLSFNILLHTEFPHIRAIGAYLDRVITSNVTAVVV